MTTKTIKDFKILKICECGKHIFIARYHKGIKLNKEFKKKIMYVTETYSFVAYKFRFY